PVLLPNRRIDYILVGRPRRGGAGHVLAGALAGVEPVQGIVPSDHYAVVADLRYSPRDDDPRARGAALHRPLRRGRALRQPGRASRAPRGWTGARHRPVRAELPAGRGDAGIPRGRRLPRRGGGLAPEEPD